MKKLISLVAALFAAGMLFAEGFTVKSVTGKVTVVTASGKTDPVKVGQTLSGSTVINTRAGATLVVTKDGKDYTIRSMKKDTVDVLVSGKKAVAANQEIADAASTTGKGEASLSFRNNLKSATAGDNLQEDEN